MKSSTVEDLAENLRQLLEDAEALLRASAGKAGSGFDALRRTCDHLRNAKEEASNKARQVNDTVHAHPWQALAITAAVAFIAGLAVRRR